MSDVSDELMRGKMAFLRGDPLPIRSASASFTYAYRAEEHIRNLESQLAAATRERDEAREALQKLCDTWDEHWDCSASPGHEPMHADVNAARAALAAAPKADK